jgi:hypothetical protein
MTILTSRKHLNGYSNWLRTGQFGFFFRYEQGFSLTQPRPHQLLETLSFLCSGCLMCLSLRVKRPDREGDFTHLHLVPRWIMYEALYTLGHGAQTQQKFYL